MLRYNKFGGRIFFAADTATGGGGSAGNPAANQGGGGAVDDGSTTEIKDPTAGLNLEDFDPDTRKIIEDSRKGFAALQKRTADAEAAKQHELNQKKQFQANYDVLAAELKKVTGGQQQQSQTDPRKVQLEKFTQILVSRNVPPDQAKVQAEIMLEMMTDFGTAIKTEIGAGLGPMAHTMVAREAEHSWSAAVQMDRTGAMQIDEVAKEAWSQVETLVGQGQTVNAATVQNLVGMAYFNYLQKGGNPQQQQQQQQQVQQQLPQFQQMGRLTYPGAGAQPFRPAAVDPNAPKHALDADTDAALQVVMGKWATGQGAVKAPAFRGAIKR